MFTDMMIKKILGSWSKSGTSKKAIAARQQIALDLGIEIRNATLKATGMSLTATDYAEIIAKRLRVQMPWQELTCDDSSAGRSQQKQVPS